MRKLSQNPLSRQAWLLLFVFVMLLVFQLFSTLVVLAQRNGANVEPPAAPSAITPNTRFDHLRAEDGLAQNSVQAILQDRHGFLWIGTQNGLSRYDGYRFVTYRHDPANPNSLSHNFVRALWEDRAGKLWIATQGGGADRFDPLTETFTHYQQTPQNPEGLGAAIFAIFEDSQGNFWFGGPPESGLTKLAFAEGQTRSAAEGIHWTHYYPTLMEGGDFPGGAIWEIVEDRAGLLWLAADNGLVSLDLKTETFVAYPAAANERRLAALWLDDKGELWAGGSSGLYHLNLATQQLELFPQSPLRINDLRQDRAGQLWVSTHGDGLYRFDPQAAQFVQQARHYASDLESLSEDRVTALWQDQEGVLWIGTDGAGLNRLTPRQNQFVSLSHRADDPKSLAEDHVTAIAGDADHTVWIGTGAILNQLDLATGQVKQYQTPAPQTAQEKTNGAEASNTIYALYVDQADFLWVGLNNNQVLRFDPHIAQFTPYSLPVATQPRLPGPPSEVAGFYEDKLGALWVAVNVGGLYRIDPARTTVMAVPLPPPPVLAGSGKERRPLPPPPSTGGKSAPSGPPPLLGGRLNAITGDPTGRIWLGYQNGRVLRVDPTPPAFAVDQPLPENIEALLLTGLTAIHVDAKTPEHVIQIWLATHNGLVRVDLATGTTQTYHERDGLPSSLLVAILADHTGCLWFGTDKGLTRFDPQSGRFRNFDKADGLPGNEFRPNAAWQAADGQLFFGSTEGVAAFYPETIVDNLYQPPVFLTELRLYNEPVAPGPKSLLREPIWATRQLTLQHDQASVAFEFTALSYAAPQKNRYRYKLEGLEQEWNTVGSDRRFVTYTSLPAGRYTLRVQGSNSDGVWSEQEVALALTVLPPWWQTLWFRGIVVVLIAGLAYAGYQWRVHAIEAQNRLLEAQVAQRTQALTESEARFRGLATSAFEAILIHDAWRIVDANEAATRLFGYTHADLLAKNLADLLTPLLPAFELTSLASTDSQSLGTNDALPIATTLTDTQPAIPTTAYEVTGLTVTGEAIPLEMRLRAAPYQGRLATLIALHDLTERKQIETQRQRVAALEERERIGRELHDDLGQVMGYMNVQAQTVRELLEQDQREPARALLIQLTEVAQKAHEDVRQYILGIRSETNHTTLGFVEALQLYLMRLRERHGLDVSLSLPENLGENFSRDFLAPEAETQLLRIIQEALTNVRKHASVNNARLLFTLHTEGLQVVIADEGKGFALHSSLSNPHFGLDIMRERAARIGGELEIRSTPDAGTQVIVRLPRQLQFEETETVRGLRVLLVDDHPLYLEGLRNMLAARGLQVVGMARDGVQAQHLARTLYPDLILMDVEMPGCNGIEATRLIKAALPQTKIVMLTVAAEEETLFEALKQGASGYLLKNLDSGQFFHLLREVMRGETVLSPRLATEVLATFAQDGRPSMAVDETAIVSNGNKETANLPADKSESAEADLLPTLTHRQQAVLKLVVQGLTNKEIAKELSITERTVKYHIGLILERLQLRSRYELARYAQEQGFVRSNFSI